MSVVDIIIVAVIVVSLTVGLVRGFVREMLSLAAWVAALWVAYVLAVPGAVFFESYISQPPLRVVAAFAVIFVLTLIAASFLGHLLERLFTVSGLGGVDRALGVLFGVGRGIIMVALLLLMAVFMELTTQPWWQESRLVNYFTPVVDELLALMPQDLAAYFQPKGGPI